ncbi:MAG TPA: hypothetical protein VFI25_05130 [Planctomycetota bacterium]|jgi:hypothetical protein|nr:hypothetical protein [Planctomycetota bacterium]
MRRRAPCIEILDEDVARSLRRMTPARRFALGSEEERSVRVLVAAAVREQHPRWSEGRVSREVARRFGLGSD